MGLLDRIFRPLEENGSRRGTSADQVPTHDLNAVWDSADRRGQRGEGVVVHLPGLRRELLARRGCGATRQ